MGPPDLALKMPADFTVPADKLEVTQEFTLPTGSNAARWVRAVDLLPGNPSVVRSAQIFMKGADASGPGPAPERLLALWLPGQDPEPLEGRVAFRLPAGAELGVRIHYKKTWQFEGQALTDRSTVGVYFAPDSEAQELLTLPVTSAQAAASDRTISFSRTIDEDVQALGLRPDDIPPNIVVQVQAVLPDGSHAELVRWNSRPDWGRRYWFEKPIALPRGSRIEVVANLDNPDILSEAFAVPDAKTPAAPPPLRLALNVIPAKSKPTAP
jgi:hypothetical protein